MSATQQTKARTFERTRDSGARNGARYDAAKDRPKPDVVSQLAIQVRPTVNDAVLRDLVRSTTPVASVYIGPRSPAAADLAEDVALRVRALLRELERQGADEATVAAVRHHVSELGAYPTGRVLIVADGTVRFAGDLPDAVWPDVAWWGAPAVVTPMVAWLAGRPAYVTVLTDRTGAEITRVARGMDGGETSTVVGPDDEIERNAPGGWAQPRYQRRAEDSWQHNATAVAEAAVRAVHAVRAGLLLVAGDVRAVQLLRQRLAHDHLDVDLQHLPGGRHPDGSAAARATAIAAAVDEYATRRATATVRRLVDAPKELATQGAAATLAALAEARVDTLIVVDDGDDRLAWFGPSTLCAMEPPQPREGAVRGRLVDVAVRAALLTDADICVLPRRISGVPAGGIGAICRYPL